MHVTLNKDKPNNNVDWTHWTIQNSTLTMDQYLIDRLKSIKIAICPSLVCECTNITANSVESTCTVVTHHRAREVSMYGDRVGRSRLFLAKLQWETPECASATIYDAKRPSRLQLKALLVILIEDKRCFCGVWTKLQGHDCPHPQ